MHFVALGHEEKAFASGLLNFHELLWSRRLLEARGKKSGTAGYEQLKKGTYIRETNRHVLMEAFALTVALAKDWLRRQSGELVRSLAAAEQASNSSTMQCLDAYGRPIPLVYGPARQRAAEELRAALLGLVGVASQPVQCDSVQAWTVAVAATVGSSGKKGWALALDGVRRLGRPANRGDVDWPTLARVHLPQRSALEVRRVPLEPPSATLSHPAPP